MLRKILLEPRKRLREGSQTCNVWNQRTHSEGALKTRSEGDAVSTHELAFSSGLFD